MHASDKKNQDSTLTFYHAPQTRSSGLMWLLEELEVPYQLQLVDIRGGAPESYRAIQPHKKVPAIVHEGVTITERAAISIYLSERFPRGALTPGVGDPRRGPYLSWLVYADSVFDPALTSRFMKWEFDPSMVSFGAFADMERHLVRTLSERPYLLGEEATLADLALAGSMGWAMNAGGYFKEQPVLVNYVARLQARPSWQRSLQKDARLTSLPPQ